MCLIDDDKIVSCDLIHHIIPVRFDFNKRWDIKELIPLCHRCHNSIDHNNYTEETMIRLRKLLAEYHKKYMQTPQGV